MTAFRTFTLPSLCAALLACPAGAQTTPPPSSAAAHTHAPVTLDQFITSATPFQRNQVDLAQSTTVLSGRSLLLKQQATLCHPSGGVQTRLVLVSVETSANRNRPSAPLTVSASGR